MGSAVWGRRATPPHLGVQQQESSSMEVPLECQQETTDLAEADEGGAHCPAFLLSGGVKPQPSFHKQPLDWEADIQLYSWFLDRKEELQTSHAVYVRQHPEIQALLADFLQALLLQQPHDLVSFASQFFAPFGRQWSPGTPFASAGTDSSLPSPLHHDDPQAKGE